jgi:hypothetical protein
MNYKLTDVDLHTEKFKEDTGFTIKLLLFCMQVLEPVLKTLVYNFITERNSSDVIAIG